MNQEAGRNAISNGRKNEEKSRNHSEESIRPARYAKAICSDPGKRRAKVNIDLNYFLEAATSALLSRALRR